ncbi:hypothetical protein B0T10DRAFT_497395 [Thelonectria olida]|uniref:Uncharacterized protein n=1 Tax=Thelonectria olida TaxID=1576542 RepID=A0A9P8VX09_9HYPO|nr:hypothetical protein B0T10DRAFT_497395 [Thelonectria olida]
MPGNSRKENLPPNPSGQRKRRQLGTTTSSTNATTNERPVTNPYFFMENITDQTDMFTQDLPKKAGSSRVLRTRQSLQRSPSPPTKRRRHHYTRNGSPASEEAKVVSASSKETLLLGYKEKPRSAGQFSGLLFSSPRALWTTISVDQQQLIIDTIQERAEGTEDNPNRLERRLDDVYETLRWWGAVGCEFCFVMSGNAQPGHTLEKCDRWHGCEKAGAILRWLESLEIPKFVGVTGFCSMCTHTWFPCGDICLSNSISYAGSEQERAELVKELQSQPGFDGHCERKPITRRVIAVLCAYDDQFLAEILVRLALDRDHVDLSIEQSARAWFEHQIPHKDSWIPRLLFIFETLTVGFYVRRNYRLGLPPLDNLPQYPPGPRLNNLAPAKRGAPGSTLLRPDEDVVVKRWEATIQWWRWKCSYCIGSGRQGEAVDHDLRECVYGGAEAVETEFGNAIYGEGRAPSSTCYRCYLPRQLCEKWSKTSAGGWIERDKAEWTCRYKTTLLRDIIVGLYESRATKFMDDMRNAAAQWYEKERRGPSTEVNDETVADFLLRGFTNRGVGGIEMMRQLALWSRTVWYHKTVGELLPPDDEVEDDDDDDSSGPGPRSESPDIDVPSRRSNWPPRLRRCEAVSLDTRSARARCSVQERLDSSLIHRHHGYLSDPYTLSRSPKPMNTWSPQDISTWCERRAWQCPSPIRWRESWTDDQSNDLVTEERVQKQLERWSVRCPLCLLHRDPACDEHPLSSCPRFEGCRARSIRGRLWEGIVKLQANGIKGYGPVPWCGDCCLPRSCCPAWASQDAADTASEWEALPWGGDHYACKSSLVRGWRRQDGKRCEFREVVVNAVSAMCAFSLSDDVGAETDTFWDQIEVWRSQSGIRFNQDWGTNGWLLSPMPWGAQDVMVMLNVFCRLDVVVEDLWIEEAVDQRRIDLVIPSSEANCLVIKRQHQAQPRRQRGMAAAESGDSDGETMSLWRSHIQEALNAAEAEEERSFGYWGDLAYLSALGARVQAWHRGRIRCQVCLMYEWSEACYLHDMGACTLHSESKPAMALVHKWSGIRGAEGGQERQCSRCRFPLVVCRLIRHEDADDVGDDMEADERCSGVETLCRTVAVLLTVADGVLGDVVIEEEMGNQKWDKNYDRLSRGWMEDQVRIGNCTVPRIVRLFQRLLDGFIGLSRIRWKK